LPKSHPPTSVPSERRKRRSSEALLQQVLSAAAVEFQRFGYSGATTAAIARGADVTEAQLFRYFDSKAALFREAVFKPLDQQLAAFLDLHMGDEDPDIIRQSMADYIDELQTFIADRRQLLTSLFMAQTYEPNAAEGLATVSSLATYFDRGAATSRARLTGVPRVDPRLMVRVSFAAVLGCVLFKDWIFPAELADDQQIGDAINGFIREGLAANPGIGPIIGWRGG
jgi:AcrR family transcriptional regulator